MIPEGMDTISSVLVAIILISAGVQLLYMISPRKLKQFLEYLDFDDRVDQIGGKKFGF